MYGKIVVVTRDGKDGASYPMDRKSVMLGRMPECDIRIQLPSVSRHHCRLSVNAMSQVMVTNLSSVNPTRINGKAVKSEGPIYHGDHIQVDDRFFRFEYPPTSLYMHLNKSASVKDFAAKMLEVLNNQEEEQLYEDQSENIFNTVKKARKSLSAMASATPGKLTSTATKRISFAPKSISPEIIDKNLPASMPVKRGSIPASPVPSKVRKSLLRTPAAYEPLKELNESGGSRRSSSIGASGSRKKKESPRTSKSVSPKKSASTKVVNNENLYETAMNASAIEAQMSTRKFITPRRSRVSIKTDSPDSSLDSISVFLTPEGKTPGTAKVSQSAKSKGKSPKQVTKSPQNSLSAENINSSTGKKSPASTTKKLPVQKASLAKLSNITSPMAISPVTKKNIVSRSSVAPTPKTINMRVELLKKSMKNSATTADLTMKAVVKKTNSEGRKSTLMGKKVSSSKTPRSMTWADIAKKRLTPKTAGSEQRVVSKLIKGKRSVKIRQRPRRLPKHSHQEVTPDVLIQKPIAVVKPIVSAEKNVSAAKKTPSSNGLQGIQKTTKSTPMMQKELIEKRKLLIARSLTLGDAINSPQRNLQKFNSASKQMSAPFTDATKRISLTSKGVVEREPLSKSPGKPEPTPKQSSVIKSPGKTELASKRISVGKSPAKPEPTSKRTSVGKSPAKPEPSPKRTSVAKSPAKPEPTPKRTSVGKSPGKPEPSPKRTSVGKSPAKPEPTPKRTSGDKIPAKPQPTPKRTSISKTPAKPEPTPKRTSISKSPAKPEPSPKRTSVGKTPAKPEPTPKRTSISKIPAKPEPSPKGTSVGKSPAKPEPTPKRTSVDKSPAKPEPTPKRTSVGKSPAKPEPTPKRTSVGKSPAKPEPTPKRTSVGKSPAKPEPTPKPTSVGKSPSKPEPTPKRTPVGKSPAKPEPFPERTSVGKSPAKPEPTPKRTSISKSPAKPEPSPKRTSVGKSPGKSDTEIKRSSIGKSPSRTKSSSKGAPVIESLGKSSNLAAELIKSSGESGTLSVGSISSHKVQLERTALSKTPNKVASPKRISFGNSVKAGKSASTERYVGIKANGGIRKSKSLSPKNMGLKKLFKTPETRDLSKSPRLSGVSELLKTPVGVKLPVRNNANLNESNSKLASQKSTRAGKKKGNEIQAAKDKSEVKSSTAIELNAGDVAETERPVGIHNDTGKGKLSASKKLPKLQPKNTDSSLTNVTEISTVPETVSKRATRGRKLALTSESSAQKSPIVKSQENSLSKVKNTRSARKNTEEDEQKQNTETVTSSNVKASTKEQEEIEDQVAPTRSTRARRRRDGEQVALSSPVGKKSPSKRKLSQKIAEEKATPKKSKVEAKEEEQDIVSLPRTRRGRNLKDTEVVASEEPVAKVQKVAISTEPEPREEVEISKTSKKSRTRRAETAVTADVVDVSTIKVSPKKTRSRGVAFEEDKMSTSHQIKSGDENVAAVEKGKKKGSPKKTKSRGVAAEVEAEAPTVNSSKKSRRNVAAVESPKEASPKKTRSRGGAATKVVEEKPSEDLPKKGVRSESKVASPKKARATRKWKASPSAKEETEKVEVIDSPPKTRSLRSRKC